MEDDLGSLAEDFQFNQGVLQDYVDCPRLFQLRHLLHVEWPAVAVEPLLEQEKQTQEGIFFHRLLQQHAAGLPSERLTALVEQAGQDMASQELGLWWKNYLHYAPDDLPGERFAEATLSTELGGFRLVAKYDLLVMAPDQRCTILDWKTSRRRPKRQGLVASLQTRVYLYLAARAGAWLNQEEAIAPERIRMVYWFANFPDQPESIAYDAARYRADEDYLLGLIEEIRLNRAEVFPLTNSLRRCRYCRYRSLCERGSQAGELAEVEELDVANSAPPGDAGIDFDFDQVPEIAF